jgi:hypothetical protein
MYRGPLICSNKKLLLVLAMTVIILSGCHTRQVNQILSQRDQIGYSFLQSNSTLQQLPWQIPLQIQQDKPLTIYGYVLDVDGRPIKKTHLAVFALLPFPVRPRSNPPQLLGHTTTDGNGFFSASMPSPALHQCYRLYVIVRQKGYGLGIKDLDPAVFDHEIIFRLKPEFPLRGRVVGPDNKPAIGVQVHLRLIAIVRPGSLPTALALMGPTDKPLSFWPPPSISDDQGRFVLQGIPSIADSNSLCLEFEIDDPRYAPYYPELFPVYERGAKQREFLIRGDNGDEIVLELDEPRFVEGKAIKKDTKEPISDAWVSVSVCNSNQTGDLQETGIWVKTNQFGRFKARCRKGQYLTIYVYPPVGEPYPAWVEKSKEWPEGSMYQDVVVEVPRGILANIKVIEEDTREIVSGAIVEYQLRTQKTPYYDEFFSHQIYWAAEYRKILTDDKGMAKIAVVPGTGYFMVKAPTPDFVSRYVTHGELQYDKPGGFWYITEGLAKIDPKPERDIINLTIPLTRGATVQGCVLDPKGEFVKEAMLLTPAYPRLLFTHHIGVSAWIRPVKNGYFELKGCDPTNLRTVYFLDAKHQWGATLYVTKVQNKPLTVHLLPCGSATVRFVDQKGHPWVNVQVPVSLSLIFSKSPVNQIYGGQDSRNLDWRAESLDRQRYNALQTDANGYIVFPTLIPGAPYILQLFDSPMTCENVKEKEFEFTVQSGQTLDLGEIMIKRFEETVQ